MKVALGQQVAGYFANHEALASAIFEAGEASGEPFWRFPLVSDYEDKLASKVADADNAAGGAGSITAALFLQHFVGSVPWAHLDIASVGDSPTESFEWTAGPTGFGARALLAWLGSPDPLEGILKRRMHALTVRWSLTDAPDGVEEKLAAYVEETSHARFTGMDGLRFKTWRCGRGSGSRAATSSPPTRPARRSRRDFTAAAAESPGSQIIGSAPVLIEPCDVVAVAEGGEGFLAAPRTDVTDATELSAIVALGCPFLLGDQQPVADGQQQLDQLLVLGDLPAELADGDRLLVALGGVGHPVVPQRVVERHHATGAQQPQRLLEVGGVLDLVAVGEDQVVVAVGEPRQHVEGGAGDRAHALGRHAGVVVGLARQPLVLGLDVDGGQHAVAAHAAQQPDPGDAGAGADLDDRAGVEHRRQEPERRAAARADRRHPHLLGADPGRREDVVLGDEGLRVGPGRRLGRTGRHVATLLRRGRSGTAGNTVPPRIVVTADESGLSGSSQDPSLP